MNADLVRIRQLMNMTRGDEKHGSSTSSTLDEARLAFPCCFC